MKLKLSFIAAFSLLILYSLVTFAYADTDKIAGIMSELSNSLDEIFLRSNDAANNARRAYFSTNLNEAQEYARKAMEEAERARLAASSSKDLLEQVFPVLYKTESSDENTSVSFEEKVKK